MRQTYVVIIIIKSHRDNQVRLHNTRSQSPGSQRAPGRRRKGGQRTDVETAAHPGRPGRDCSGIPVVRRRETGPRQVQTHQQRV